jgi:hypothetical protein
MIADRDGAQIGAAANALSNRMPSAARRSRFGVRAHAAPG